MQKYSAFFFFMEKEYVSCIIKSAFVSNRVLPPIETNYTNVPTCRDVAVIQQGFSQRQRRFVSKLGKRPDHFHLWSFFLFLSQGY